MSDIQSLISNLLGRIFLKKPVFFGMDTYDITVVVGPSMKVYAIHATPKKLKDKFPFTEKRRPFKGLKTALEYIWVSNRTVLFVVQVLASDKNVLNFGRI